LHVTEFVDELDVQLTTLVAFAREMNELDLSLCVMSEARGMQDAGWNTSQTAYEVFAELQTLGQIDRALTRAEFRSALALYTQLAEAGGVYEGLRSMMAVIELKPYSMWPFRELVRRRGNPARVIGPNANATFRALATTAREIGMLRLSKLLEVAFRDDIRNGIAHADYIIWNDRLRLRRRNGGFVEELTLEQVSDAIAIGLNFFNLLQKHRDGIALSFRPGRDIYGRFSLNPPMLWRVELGDDGLFGIRNAPGPFEPTPEFDRQTRINNYLGGKVFAIFTPQLDQAATGMLDHMAAEGYEPTIVVMPDAQQYTNLNAEVEQHGLWDWRSGERQEQADLLIATPFGFRRNVAPEQFASLLPDVTVDDCGEA
jgi:hypothetical protein